MPRWSNWAGEQICAPTRIVTPVSEDQLAEAVHQAASEGLEVRAVGSGHSFTDCACTDGMMIDMGSMRGVITADPATGQVTVQGGVRLHELGPALAQCGLALENQGDIDRQTITGAISTATHGTGVRFPNLSAQVIGLRLVDADGQVHDLRRDDDTETFLAARVSLGALGVISAATLQCVPLYALHRVDAPMSLADTLSHLDELVDGNDHFEFFIFPHTLRALTRRSRRSLEDPIPTPRWRRLVEEELLENGLLGLLCRLGRAVPRLAPTLNRTVAAALSASEVSDRSYRVYATHRAVRFTEMEYGIPRPHAADAVRHVLELIIRRKLPILFPLEVRFTAADDALLSTAHGRETCYVAVHQYRGMEFESFFRGVEAIMDEYVGRPHWGKRHYQTAATLRERYPDWDRFQAIRARLDPSGVFANDYVRRVLGAPAPAGAGHW